MNDLENTLTPLAAQLAKVQDQISTWQDAEKGIKAQIRDLVQVSGPDTYQAGPLTVLVSSNRRWDAKLAATVIPAELLPLVSVQTFTVDKKKVEVLCPDQWDACFIEHDLIVKIR